MTTCHFEEWRRVPSIEGLEASSHGRVRCTSYIQGMPYGGSRVRSFGPTIGQVGYGSKASTYRRMIFRFRGSTYKVHRAVCEAFHGPAPKNKPVVMHIDEDGRNNVPNNLKWATQKENLNCAKFKSERCGGIVRRAA